jgi:hypothetical protein
VPVQDVAPSKNETVKTAGDPSFAGWLPPGLTVAPGQLRDTLTFGPGVS